MMGKLSRRLRRSFEKNASEAKAFLTGQMPSFITQRAKSTSLDEVPVFVFHDIDAKWFEAKLLYLRSNSYRTLDANELEAVYRREMREGPAVCLTFDDATWTFWAYAYPLLKKYDFRAILFAIPGIVPEDATLYPNLEDVWEGRCTREDLDRREKIQPLCTWRELAIMHRSGIVDIQSHSLTHARVHVSSRLVDFLHPGFDTYFSNLSVPISSLDHPEHPERKLRLGAPVFEFAPRLAGRRRFKETPALIEAMTGYVEEHGRSTFFDRPSWRKELEALCRQWPAEKLGSFETSEEMESAIRRELAGSRKVLEERLLNNEVRHFCYPWFGSSDMADRLAIEAGYWMLHYGPALDGRKMQTTGRPLRIRRISEEYFFRLPGDGRLSLWSIWTKRGMRFVRKNIPSLRARMNA
jgi:peptidoglycan/xylan/chitin deacetylase (PgdA/CDA1 family)